MNHSFFSFQEGKNNNILNIIIIFKLSVAQRREREVYENFQINRFRYFEKEAF
jgi:hypothetical protein